MLFSEFGVQFSRFFWHLLTVSLLLVFMLGFLFYVQFLCSWFFGHCFLFPCEAFTSCVCLPMLLVSFVMLPNVPLCQRVCILPFVFWTLDFGCATALFGLIWYFGLILVLTPSPHFHERFLFIYLILCTELFLLYLVCACNWVQPCISITSGRHLDTLAFKPKRFSPWGDTNHCIPFCALNTSMKWTSRLNMLYI